MKDFDEKTEFDIFACCQKAEFEKRKTRAPQTVDFVLKILITNGNSPRDKRKELSFLLKILARCYP